MYLQRKDFFFSILLADLIFYSASNASSFDQLDSEVFQQCLFELKIPELLRLQRSLTHISAVSTQPEGSVPEALLQNVEKCKVEDKCDAPKAMALVAEKRGNGQHSYVNHQLWQVEEKPSKLQTLFQISITALTFLSFGGYLLCLIVQAIKSKGTTYFHPVATATTTNGNGGVKRIKIYRRSRRSYKKDIFFSYSQNMAFNPYIIKISRSYE